MKKIIDIPVKKQNFIVPKKYNVMLMESLELFFHCDKFYWCVCVHAFVWLYHWKSYVWIIDVKIIYSLTQAQNAIFCDSKRHSQSERVSSNDKQVNADTICTIYFFLRLKSKRCSCADIKRQEYYIHPQPFCVWCSAFCYNSETSVRFYGLVNELQ